MGTFIGLILASGGFCTALVVVGVYIGSFKSKFVSQSDYAIQNQIILNKLEDMNQNITDLKIEFTKIQAIEK